MADQASASATLTGDQGAAKTQTTTGEGGAVDNKASSTGQNGQTPAFDYKTGVAEEYHGLWQKKGWESPNDLIKSYTNLENMLNANDRLFLPADDNDEKGWNEVYTKMGRPARPEDYKFEDMAEGHKRNEDVSKWFKDMAFKNGLSQKQAASLEKNWNVFAEEMNAKLEETQTQAVANDMAQMKAKWGAKYDDNLALAKSAAAKLGGQNIADAIDALSDKAGFAQVMEMFHNIGVRMGEANFVSGDTKGQNTGTPMNKQAMLKEIQDTMADPDYLNGDKNPARHRQLVDRVTRLYEETYKDEELPSKGTSVRVG